MEKVLSSCMELKNSKKLCNRDQDELAVDSEHLTSNLQVQNCFDTVAKLCSSSLSDNPTAVLKLLKCIESLQTYLDVQNQYLVEYYAKSKENLIIQLGRRSSDLKHRQELQALLLSAIKDNDLNKAALINSVINQSTYIPVMNSLQLNSSSTAPNSFSSSNFIQQPTCSANAASTLSNFILDNFASRNIFSDSKAASNLNSEHDTQDMNTGSSSFDDNVFENSSNDGNMQNNSIDKSSVPTASSALDSEQKTQNGETSTNGSSTTVFTLTNDPRSRIRYTPLSPIRHLICSPGLEATAHRYRISILYRGVCNGMCYQNKPWSNQVHLHYIVNTVNCNDHISRLVKKQGIQFYNSFVLQNPERLNQLIQLYKMERVKQPSASS
jgi:hypothetical protein